MNQQALHLVRLNLDAAALGRMAVRSGLQERQNDVGYLVHALLAALFSGNPLRPFRVLDETRRHLEILAYSPIDDAELLLRAEQTQHPSAWNACDWGRFSSKPVPSFREGQRLSFSCRICPVVRLSSATETIGKDGEPQVLSAGAEIDAWLQQSFLHDNGGRTTRDDVYRSWLAKRLDGKAALEDFSLESFRRAHLVRRTQGSQRKSRVLERPDAISRGTMRVTDPASFHQLLSAGAGRHTAFGFGMLLLSPPPLSE